jgi:hypothetical protein
VQPVPRALFGIFAFLPTAGVLVLSFLLTTNPIFERIARDPLSALRSGRYDVLLVGMGLAFLAIALVQIALGIAVAIHTHDRRDLTPGEKMGWTLACLFVGSIALPIFFFTKTRPPA